MEIWLILVEISRIVAETWNYDPQSILYFVIDIDSELGSGDSCSAVQRVALAGGGGPDQPDDGGCPAGAARRAGDAEGDSDGPPGDRQDDREGDRPPQSEVTTNNIIFDASNGMTLYTPKISYPFSSFFLAHATIHNSACIAQSASGN